MLNQYDQEGLASAVNLGKGGVTIRDNAGVFESRNTANSAYSNFRALGGQFDGNVTMDVNLTLGGASPVLSMGDDTASPFVDFRGAAGDQGVRWYASSFIRNRITQNATNLFFSSHDGAGALQFNTQLVNATGSWVMPADLSLSGGAPVLTLGDGLAGTKTLAIDTANASQGQLRYHTAGAIRWNVAKVATSDDYVIERYTGSSSLQGTPFQIASSDGLVTINGTTLAAGSTVTMPAGLAIAGATIADGHVSADELVIGDGVGSRGVTIFSGTSAISRIVFADTAAAEDGSFGYEHASQKFFWKVGGSTELHLDAAAFFPDSDAGLDLGIDGTRWATVFSDNLTAGGAVVADGQSGRNDLVLGDGVGDRGMFIFSGIASSAWMVFTDTAATNNNGAFQYSMAGARFQIYTAGAHVINLSATDFGPQVDSNTTLGTNTRRWSTVFADNLTAGGGQVADGPTAENDLVVGDGVGNRGITIFTGTGSSGAVNYTDVSGSVIGRSRYSHTASAFFWSIAGTQELVLNASLLGPQTDAGLVLGSSTVRWGDVHADTAHIAGDFFVGSSAGREEVRKNPGSVQTTDGTVTTILTLATLALDANTAKINCWVSGVGVGGTVGNFDNRSQIQEFLVYRASGSLVFLTAHFSNIQSNGAGSTWAITFTTSGNDIIAQVAGNTGETVQWDAIADVQVAGG